MATPDLELTFRDGGTGDASDPYTGLDRFGRLVETLWQVPGSGDARVQSGYGRNRVGGVVWRRDEAAHAQSVDTEDNYYWYDGLQQIRERQRGNLSGTAPDYTGIDSLQQEEDWSYDATGNWRGYGDTNPANGQARTHNEANEITEIAPVPSGTPVEPAYDAAGNMLTLPREPGLSTAQYDLQWDAWNRLVAVRDGSTLVAGYTYDGLTRRQTKKSGTAETRHYYYSKDWRAVEERVESATRAVDRQYTWGLRDRWDLLRRRRSVTGLLDEALYVLRDYLDPVAIADDSGDVVERIAYDAFGGVRFLAPDYSARTASDFAWDFLFHAEFRDQDTGLYNYGYRYYYTGLGRWLSRDPLLEDGGANQYRAFDNRPACTLDLNGLATNIRQLNLDVYPEISVEWKNIFQGLHGCFKNCAVAGPSTGTWDACKHEGTELLYPGKYSTTPLGQFFRVYDELYDNLLSQVGLSQALCSYVDILYQIDLLYQDRSVDDQGCGSGKRRAIKFAAVAKFSTASCYNSKGVNKKINNAGKLGKELNAQIVGLGPCL